jgi:pimeloyl-ACP methyl ester carboxylesterase
MKWNLKNVLYFGSAIIIIYILGVLSIYIFINSILFTTNRTNNYDFAYSNRMKEVMIPLPEHQEIYSLLCTPPQKEKAIVLYLHGVNGSLNSYFTFSSNFTSRNLATLMPDYRGFGKSKGDVIENSLLEDALASMDWIRKRYREDSVVIYAQDFMAPIACTIAGMIPCRLVILENPVYSLRRWMREKFPALILPYELKYDFDCSESLPNSICPVYILQTKNSPNCSPSDARKLQMLLKDPNALIWLDSTKTMQLSNLDQYQQTLDQLFSF